MFNYPLTVWDCKFAQFGNQISCIALDLFRMNAKSHTVINGNNRLINLRDWLVRTEVSPDNMSVKLDNYAKWIIHPKAFLLSRSVYVSRLYRFWLPYGFWTRWTILILFQGSWRSFSVGIALTSGINLKNRSSFLTVGVHRWFYWFMTKGVDSAVKITNHLV